MATKTTPKETPRPRFQRKKEPAAPWYQTGQEGYSKKTQIDTTAKMRKEKFATRFWLKEGTEGVIVFVDDVGFFIHSHQLKIGDSWQNFFTCVKDLRPCPICDQGHKSSYIAYFTVIDTRQYVRETDGVVVKNKKVLYPAKGSTIKKIEDLKKKRGSLVGMAFRVKRYTAEDPNCGSDLEFLKKADLVKNFGKEAIIPLDYMKILSPPSDEELANLGIGTHLPGSTEDTTSSGDSDGGISDLL